MHPDSHTSIRLVSPTALLQSVRMSHDWAGGIVPPWRWVHQEAVNPPPPSICLRLLFRAKQTTRFPMRAPSPHTASSADMLYGSHSQMKTVKTPFLKKVCLCRWESEAEIQVDCLHKRTGCAINWHADHARRSHESTPWFISQKSNFAPIVF